MPSPVLNYLDLKKDKGGKKSKFKTSFVQPSQFIPQEEKTDDWYAWNMDWFEQQGLKQVNFNFHRYIRNIRLANGVIDRRDYTNCEENEYGDVFKIVSDDNDAALELKFFPIIPSIINLFQGELSQKKTQIQWVATDNNSYNEKLNDMSSEIEDSLIKQMQNKFLLKLVQQGYDPGSKEVQEQTSPEAIKSLPEIHQFYTKNYRTLVEQWCQHQQNYDVEKFHIREMEQRQFVHYLTHDKEFWHFNMRDDDFSMEEWEPIMTAIHKSPGTQYASQASWVTHFDKYTVADIIDDVGYLLEPEQVTELERLMPGSTHLMNMVGQDPHSFYDPNESFESNMNMPSVAYRQFEQGAKAILTNNSFIDKAIRGDAETTGLDDPNYLRKTTIYWKTQRKVGHLTEIDEKGNLTQDIVSEDFEVTIPGVYDKTYTKAETRDNLAYGEHVDWYWINEVCGGIKIGPNIQGGFSKYSNFEPIYLGINQKKPGRLKFQLKGDLTTFGCKLPVEGWLGSSRHIWDCSLVNTLAPFQLLHNMSMNQLTDFQIGEFGTILTFDKNTLPKDGLDGDWGRDRLEKTFVVMKDYSMLPLDTTLANTEQGVQTGQLQMFDLSQTQRLLGRMQIADYYKQKAYETIGVTPQRMGEVGNRETATGVSAATNNSYTQTAKYFTIHCDQVMPRVHMMRTNLAQYYNSTNPSLRLQYALSSDERVNFEINGTKLLPADYGVFCTTRIDHQQLLESFKQLAIQNNTSNASMPDLGKILKADTVSEIDSALQDIEEKTQQQQQQQYEQEQKLEQQRIDAQNKAISDAQNFEMQKEQLKAQTAIEVAEIQQSGKADTSYDPSSYLDRLQRQDQFNASQNSNAQQHQDKMQLQREHNQIQREKIAAERDKASKELKTKSAPKK